MSTLLPGFFAVAVLTWMPIASAASATPLKVDARYLMRHTSEYLGKTVSVRACWVWPAPHGSIIYPCGALEHGGVMRIDYPETGKDFLSDIYVKRLHADVTHPVEADFVGTVTRETETVWRGTSQKNVQVDYLVLQDVLHPKIYRNH